MTSTSKNNGIDPKLVRELAQILHDTDLTEILVEYGDLKLRIARHVAAANAVTTVYAPAPQAPFNAPPNFAPASNANGGVNLAPANSTGAGDVAATNAILSPMVGTVYLAPEPGAPNFVKIGDNVVEGQTLLIVEAMKTMNPIAATRAGKVIELLVTDNQPVEFGQALVVVA